MSKRKGLDESANDADVGMVERGAVFRFCDLSSHNINMAELPDLLAQLQLTLAADIEEDKKTTPSKEAFDRASIDARMRVDELYRADDQLKKARDEHEANYANEVNKLDDVKKVILDRFNQLEETKVTTVAEYGDEDVTDDDLIEINAGGKVVVARRGTLTRSKGTRMEALFSGRWDKNVKR